MGDDKKWLWPALAGAMGMMVAFGVGVGAGNKWVSLSFGMKSSPVTVDPAALRPVLHEEVEKALQEAMNAQSAKHPSSAPAPPAAVQPATQTLPSRAASLVSTLHSVRSQLIHYKKQHNDRYPTFAQLRENWAALTQATNSDGTLAGGTVHVYGPYLQAAPVNPLTNKFELAPAGFPTPTCGWTYDELSGDSAPTSPSATPAANWSPTPTSNAADPNPSPRRRWNTEEMLVVSCRLLVVSWSA